MLLGWKCCQCVFTINSLSEPKCRCGHFRCPSKTLRPKKMPTRFNRSQVI